MKIVKVRKIDAEPNNLPIGYGFEDELKREIKLFEKAISIYKEWSNYKSEYKKDFDVLTDEAKQMIEILKSAIPHSRKLASKLHSFEKFLYD